MPLLGFFFFLHWSFDTNFTITLNRAFYIPDTQTRHQPLPNQTNPSLNSLSPARVSYLGTRASTGIRRRGNQVGTDRCTTPACWCRKRCGGRDPADTRPHLNWKERILNSNNTNGTLTHTKNISLIYYSVIYYLVKGGFGAIF